MGTPHDRQAPAANRLSILADAEGSRSAPRSWPLPIAFYRLAMLASVPVVVFAWPLGLRGVITLGLASGSVLVGLLLSRAARWRPAGDTWRARIWPHIYSSWEVPPFLELCEATFTIAVVGGFFALTVVVTLAGN